MNTQNVTLLLADDLFVQCQKLAPWTVNYVDLEESLAVGSIAQEKLAHGGILYALAGLSDTDRDAHIFQRDASSWSPSTLSFFSRDNWPNLIAGAYFCAQASLSTVSELMHVSSTAFEQLRLVHSEQILHVNHWRKWVSLLLNNTETKSEMVSALSDAISHSGDLISDGTDHDAIFDRWKSSVLADLSDWNIVPPASFPRNARQNGGEQVGHLLQGLRAARSASGQSNYAVY